MKTKILSTIAALIMGVSAFAASSSYMNKVESMLDDQLSVTDGKYGEDSIGCMTNLSLYREYFKQWKASHYKSEAVKDALVPWRKVFFSCPKSSQQMYLDGLKIMNYKFKKASDEQKSAYVDTIVMIYKQRMENFPTKKGKNQKGNILGRLGVELYQKAPERYDEAYNYLKESVALQQDQASVSSIVFYFRSSF
jgi:hypothetical protein